MYLQPEAVKDLFSQCAEISGEGSRIAFSYVGTRSDGRPDAGPWTRLVLWILKSSGEPWIWIKQPEELGDFVKESGWTAAPGLGPSEKFGVEFYGVAKKD